LVGVPGEIPVDGDARRLWAHAVGALDPAARSVLLSCRVLVVDDEEDIRTALAESLGAYLQGVEVLRAETGPSALAMMAHTPVDVVVSDYKMPGMNGLDFLAAVRKLRPKVIRLMLTAYPELPLAQKAVNDQHVHSFLTKPVDTEVLVGQVADALLQALRERLRDSLEHSQDQMLREVMALLAARGP
jgi:response regulator RpfG family c-di-GMP phosphodiesterase